MIVHDPNSQWLVGDGSPARVAALSRRLRQLLLDETNRELGSAHGDYVPWMAVRTQRALLKPLFVNQPAKTGPQFVEAPSTRETLHDAFYVENKHALATIVPHDIGACIDIPFATGSERAVTLVSDSLSLLNAFVPWISAIASELVSDVVPIIHRREGVPIKRGFSTPLCYGAVFLTFEDRRWDDIGVYEMAMDIAHEVGHHVLHTYQAADSILDSELTAPVYSGVKGVERPAIMSFHASVALTFMIEALSGMRGAATGTSSIWINERLEFMIGQQRKGLNALQVTRPTALGAILLDDMNRQLTRFAV